MVVTEDCNSVGCDTL